MAEIMLTILIFFLGKAKVKLENKGDLSFFAKQDEAVSACVFCAYFFTMYSKENLNITPPLSALFDISELQFYLLTVFILGKHADEVSHSN